MDRLFGTDGIRAVAGQYPLDFATCYTLGKALIDLLEGERFSPKVLVGKDTRESGSWIEQALFQGIRAGQGEAVSAGVIPTSAISFLTKTHHFSAGIVISASHNPYQDNGIKIFSSKGLKFSDKWERKLEKDIRSQTGVVKEEKIEIKTDLSLAENYREFLKRQLSAVDLQKKLRVVLDCSNGASSYFAPLIFNNLGFEVTALSNSPDGKNINKECGSLHPENLAKKVLEVKGNIGIAFDGDADRAIWVDEQGRILNGDHTLLVQSRFMRENDRLKSDYVVATTMSNMALEKALEKMGLRLFRTQVGDKYVLENMIKLKANLGGEQSGHTIFLDDCPTGDGILTSLKMLEVMTVRDLPLSHLVEGYEEFPQVLANVKVAKKIDFREFPEIMNTIERIKNELGGAGRLDVRYSGTEPLARVMVEGKDRQKIEYYAQQMTGVISKYLGKT
jgi:phosphoglucosamine mutase